MTQGIYPGAVWRPIDYSKHKACDEVTAQTLHIAVTRNEQSVFGWVQSEGSCSAFNGRFGYMEQYVPAGIQSYANSSGNHRSFSVESFDGLLIQQNPYREIGMGGIYGDSAETGLWDDGQLERDADLLAWLHAEYGVPIRAMASSHTSEHGLGGHRLGVPGWPYYDNNGGELWTSHPGKTCPGSRRMAQIPGIVARAQQIADGIAAGRCSYLPPGNVDVPSALARTGATRPSDPTTTPKDDNDMADISEAQMDQIADKVASRLTAAWLAPLLAATHVTDNLGIVATTTESLSNAQGKQGKLLTRVATKLQVPSGDL